jgi:hypothetical protein
LVIGIGGVEGLVPHVEDFFLGLFDQRRLVRDLDVILFRQGRQFIVLANFLMSADELFSSASRLVSISAMPPAAALSTKSLEVAAKAVPILVLKATARARWRRVNPSIGHSPHRFGLAIEVIVIQWRQALR